MVKYVEKIIQVPEVKNLETGEVLKDAQTVTVKVIEENPFPSLLDTRGVFLDHEKPNTPSMVNTEDYVPLPILVNRIFRTFDPEELYNVINDDSEYDEDNEFIALNDPIEQMDELEDLYGLQDSELSAHVESEQSGAQATTTTGGEAQSEADHVDSAE